MHVARRPLLLARTAADLKWPSLQASPTQQAPGRASHRTTSLWPGHRCGAQNCDDWTRNCFLGQVRNQALLRSSASSAFCCLSLLPCLSCLPTRMRFALRRRARRCPPRRCRSRHPSQPSGWLCITNGLRARVECYLGPTASSCHAAADRPCRPCSHSLPSSQHCAGIPCPPGSP